MADRIAATSPRRPRVWCPGPWPTDGRIVLHEEARHHLLRVLRMKPGDALELFDGEGRRASARLEIADASNATARIEPPVLTQPRVQLPIRLAQGLPQGDKMDWVIEKAVELGVACIQPLQAQRSVVKLEARKLAQRSAHWHRVGVAAATQCGQDWLPRLDEPQAAAAWLAEPAQDSLRLLLDPRGVPGLDALARGAAPQRIDLAIGPEAGWDARELDAAERGGWIRVRVGPRILRTETAGLAVLAALQDRWGDWRAQAEGSLPSAGTDQP